MQLDIIFEDWEPKINLLKGGTQNLHQKICRSPWKGTSLDDYIIGLKQ